LENNEKRCPICNSENFKRTDQSIFIWEILKRWESERNIEFSRKTWNHYQEFRDPVSLWQCFECGFGKFEPSVVGTDIFYKEIALQEYYFSNKWEYLQAYDAIQELGPSIRLLDIGCGNGEFLDFIKTKIPDIEAFGLEINLDAAEKARSKGHTIFDGNLLDEDSLNNKDIGQFNVITLFQVLEHLSDPISYLKRIMPFLSARGIIIIAVPDAEGPIKFFKMDLTELPPHHVSRWRQSTFEIGMPLNGLNVMKISHEPLPNYLWQQYLPVLWNTGIWPAQICQDIDNSLPFENRMTEWERINWLIEHLKELNVPWLHGVAGHTLFVTLGNLPVKRSIENEVQQLLQLTPNERMLKNILFELNDSISGVIKSQFLEIGMRIGREQKTLEAWSSQLKQERIQLTEWSNQLEQERKANIEWSYRLAQERKDLNGWSSPIKKFKLGFNKIFRSVKKD
jgi:SAM-dependent methyltransferase